MHHPMRSRDGRTDARVGTADDATDRCRYSRPTELRGRMATYIMFSNLTDEGRKTLKERPERLAK